MSKKTVEADRSFNLERTVDIITKEKLVIPYADPSLVEWCFDHLASIEAQDLRQFQEGIIGATLIQKDNLMMLCTLLPMH